MAVLYSSYAMKVMNSLMVQQRDLPSALMLSGMNNSLIAKVSQAEYLRFVEFLYNKFNVLSNVL